MPLMAYATAGGTPPLQVYLQLAPMVVAALTVRNPPHAAALQGVR